MISISAADIAVIAGFFILVLLIGYLAGRKTETDTASYFLAGKKIGLLLFVVTNVSTWYGGILGIGEFSYKYGLVTWFTQGFPYYIFAFLFAIWLVEKVYTSENITIPQKIMSVYGKTTGQIASIFIFVLSSPAPYLLMMAQLFVLLFGIPLYLALIISLLLSLIYLVKGGLRADIYVDAFLFIIMFAGFAVILYILGTSEKAAESLDSLPAGFLSLTGGLSFWEIAVWWVIAVWTFVDPGFHQRVKAAKSPSIAKKGILLSIILWFVFDALTNFTGIFAKAILPFLVEPQHSYIFLAESVLSPGLKGLFLAGLFATIISTSNSFLFISGTTLSLDFGGSSFLTAIQKKQEAVYGMIASGLVAIALALLVPSVIKIWYLIGSVCVPGMLLATLTSFFPKYKLDSKIMNLAFAIGSLSTVVWHFLREVGIIPEQLAFIEPMIIGLLGVGMLVIVDRIIKVYKVDKSS